jgi:ABC-2 type transport system permease protein
MKQVFRIAIKDFQIQVKSILSYLIIGFVMILVFSLINLLQKQMVYGMVVFTILYGFVNKALYEDERNNTLRLLAAMPVKRDVIVHARYLSTGMFMFALCMVMILITGFTDLIVHSTVEPVAVIIIAGIFMTFVILLSVYLPLAFKLGYIKAAGINRFVLLGMFAVIGGVTAVFAAVLKNKESDIPQKLKVLDEALSSMNPASVFVIVAVFVLIVYLGSWILSIRFFRKRVLF